MHQNDFMWFKKTEFCLFLCIVCNKYASTHATPITAI